MKNENRERWAVTAIVSAASVAMLLVWAVPGNVPESMNRARAEFPSADSDWLDPASFASVDRAIRDGLGAQVPISHLAGTVGTAVGLSPNDVVYLGEGGEPFFADDFIFPCRASPGRLAAIHDELLANVDRAKSAGKAVLYVVAPDKSSIRSDDLGLMRESLQRCQSTVEEAVMTWATEGEIPLVPLWQPLRQLDATRESPDGGSYYFGDTHWNAQGARVFVRAVMTWLVDTGTAPAGVLDDLDSFHMEDGVVIISDLTRSIGGTTQSEMTELIFDRQVTTASAEPIVNSAGKRLTRFRSQTSGSPLVGGRTLILGDSFLSVHGRTQLAPFFEDVTFGTLHDFEDAADYDLVIMERVQRHVAEPGWPALQF